MNNSDEIIKKLQMIPHPEGGYFKESYRNENISLIYYLLKKNEKSHWHRLTKNEILHFYNGDPLKLLISKDGKNIEEIILNNKNNNDHIFHYIVKAGTWFSMESQGEYSLIGCTVAPPFDYDDFELAPKNWKPEKF
tara:strand:- start:409 stop:816 length:408 start_codon:yes stop_codon:yes gene_type:complete